MMKKGALGLIFIFVLLGISDLSFAKKTKPPVDKDEIRIAAEKGFEAIVALWKDEEYERLYEYGRLSSHNRISKEAFAKRMKEKRWKILCCGEGARNIKAVYKSPTTIYIKAKMGYNGQLKDSFHNETFKLVLEDGRWKIDLSELLRSPKGQR